MFKTERIERLVKYAIITGVIKRDENVAPLSLMLVAPPEHNKTRILQQFEACKNVRFASDISGKPLMAFLKEARDKKISHILIPDFIKVMGHNYNVVAAVVRTMNAMMEEGIQHNMFYGQEIDLGTKVQCGLVTSMTPGSYLQQFKSWYDIGLLSRFLTVSYEYSDETRIAISKIISGRTPDGYVPHDKKCNVIKMGGPKNIKIPPEAADVILSYSDDLVSRLKTFKIEVFNNGLAQELQLELQGFRQHKQLRSLARAIAYDKGFTEVNSECLTELKDLMIYIGMPDLPKMI